MNRNRVLTIIIFVLIVLGGITLGYWLSQPSEETKPLPTAPTLITPSETRNVTSITAVDDLTDLAFSAVKGLYYISSFDEKKVYVVNPTSLAIESEIPTSSTNRLLLDDVRNRLFISGIRKVTALKLDTFETLSEVDAKAGVSEMAITSDGKYLFAINEFDNSMSVIDAENYNVIKEIPTGNRPSDVVIDRNDEYLFIANRNDGTLTIVSVDNLEVVGIVRDVGRPVSLLAYPDKDLILILDQFNDMVLVLDQTTNQVELRIPVVDYPSAMALDLEGMNLYTASFTDNTVGVVSLSAEKMIQTIQLGSGFQRVDGLNNLLFDQNQQLLVVTNTNNGQVSFVPVD